MSPAPDLTVLFVCTGNVCRSAAAEVLMRARCGPEVAVSSAGVRALVGEGVDAATAERLRELGVDPTSHRARRFAPWMAADADLVLTAERDHREAVTAEVPVAWRRVFTMREFPRLAPTQPTGPAREVVAAAAARRGAKGAVDAALDEVADPFRRGRLDAEARAAARATVAEVDDLVVATAAALGLAVRPLPADHRPRPRRRPSPVAR